MNDEPSPVSSLVLIVQCRAGASMTSMRDGDDENALQAILRSNFGKSLAARVWLTLQHHEYIPQLVVTAPTAQAATTGRGEHDETEEPQHVDGQQAVRFGNAGDGWQAVPASYAMPTTAWVSVMNKDAKQRKSRLKLDVDASQFAGGVAMLAFKPTRANKPVVPLYASRGVAVTDVELTYFAGGGRGETLLRRIPVRGLPNARAYDVGQEPVPGYRVSLGHITTPSVFLDVDVAGGEDAGEAIPNANVAWHVRRASLSIPAAELVRSLLSLAKPDLCRQTLAALAPPSTKDATNGSSAFRVEVDVCTQPGHHTAMQSLARFVGFVTRECDSQNSEVRALCVDPSRSLSELRWGSCVVAATIVDEHENLLGTCCCALGIAATAELAAEITTKVNCLNRKSAEGVRDHETPRLDYDSTYIAIEGGGERALRAFEFRVVRHGDEVAIDACVRFV